MIRFRGVCFLATILSVFTSALVINVFLKKLHPDKSNLSSPEDEIARAVASQGTDVIIVGHGRSGTTFLGELFNQNPNIFYVFEPLKFQADRLKVNIFFDEETEEYRPHMSSVMTSFLSCDLTKKKEVLSDLMASNTFRSLSKVLKENVSLEKFRTADKLSLNASRICQHFQHRVIKILLARLSEMSIESLEEVVKDSLQRGRELKILFLVRDPRAFLNSWIRHSWIKNVRNPHFERNVRRACDAVEKNLKLFENPPEWLKNRYKLVQYEDMVTEPLTIASQIYEFVGIRMVAEVEEWIKSRTKTTKGKDLRSPNFLTMKNASVSMNQWKTSLPYETKLLITRVCSSLIKKLNY